MTPNDSHYPLSRTAIEHGLDIICDKPLATNLDDALDLGGASRPPVSSSARPSTTPASRSFARRARWSATATSARSAWSNVEYVQGHNAALTAASATTRRPNWHFRPEKVGPSLIMGDIGSHAHHMATLRHRAPFARVMADIAAVVPGGKPTIMPASSSASRTARRRDVGDAGRRRRRPWPPFPVFGEKGGLEWFQEEPNQLFHSRLGAPELVLERGGPGLKPEALRAQRIGIGHPEGYQEAFAVLYADAAEAIVARKLGERLDRLARDFPTIEMASPR